MLLAVGACRSSWGCRRLAQADSLAQPSAWVHHLHAAVAALEPLQGAVETNNAQAQTFTLLELC